MKNKILVYFFSVAFLLCKQNVNAVPTVYITLNGSCLMYTSSTWTDPGTIAIDSAGNMYTPYVVKTGNVNTASNGKYIVQYSIPKNIANAITVTRTILVGDGMIPNPFDYSDTIMISADTTSNLNKDSINKIENYYRKFGLIITDSGHINATINHFSSFVISIIDSLNPCAPLKIHLIIFFTDTMKPILQLNGVDTFCLHIGDTFTFKGLSYSVWDPYFALSSLVTFMDTDMPKFGTGTKYYYIFKSTSSKCYQFKYYAKNPCVVSDTSRRWVCNCFTSVKENEKKSIFTIYPNPANHYINIECADMINTMDIKLFDVSGKVILNKNIEQVNQSSFKLDIENIRDGLYLIEIQSDKSIYRKKIQVEKY